MCHLRVYRAIVVENAYLIILKSFDVFQQSIIVRASAGEIRRSTESILMTTLHSFQANLLIKIKDHQLTSI